MGEPFEESKLSESVSASTAMVQGDVAPEQIIPGEPGGGQIQVVTRYIFLEKPTTLADVVPFAMVFFIYGLIIQTVLTGWRKVHKSSHDLFLLFLVVVFPPLLLFFLSDILFAALWAAFVLFMLCVLKKTLAHQIHKDTPREIYEVFKLVFTVAYTCTAVGQILTIGSFLFYVFMLVPALRVLLYSVYFAVLSREVAMNLSLMMASKTGFFSKEGIPGLMDSNRVCMICTGELDKSHGIITLSCGHSYHSGCIKGWFMVGQNAFCPYCKRGIDKSLFTINLWDKAELSFRPLMNFIRSFISFFIITFCYIAIKSRSRA